MTALGRDIGSQILAVAALGATAGAQATHVGRVVNVVALPTGARAQSVAVVVGAHANLDNATTLTLDQIALQSDTSDAFSSPVTRVAGASLVLSGAALNTDYYDGVSLELDLTQLPESHTFLRVSVRSALSDAVNTSGQVFATMVFGGLSTVG